MITLIVAYVVSMLLCISIVMFYAYVEREYGPTRGDLIGIVFVSLIPILNTFYAIVMTLDLIRISHDTPLHSWLRQPLLKSKED